MVTEKYGEEPMGTRQMNQLAKGTGFVEIILLSVELNCNWTHGIRQQFLQSWGLLGRMNMGDCIGIQAQESGCCLVQKKRIKSGQQPIYRGITHRSP